MLATFLKAGGYALELAGTDLPTKLFGAHVESTGYCFDAVVWINVVCFFMERDHWVTRRNLLLLLILPVLAVVLSLHVGDSAVLDPIAAGRQVLRIIQEALTNVRKHAGAGLVTVAFSE